MPDLDATLPSSLRAISEHVRLGPDVPCLVVRPDPGAVSENAGAPPFLLWMHGRTATKELDPGRYLRLARAGIGSCAIDLPGHGERGSEAGMRPEALLDNVEQAASEVDDVVTAMGRMGFDLDRMAIGGMSMGGMVALVRLQRAHRFRAAILEATSGNWRVQHQRQFFDHESADRLDPIQHLDRWRELPVLAVHSRRDEWVEFEGQVAFLDGLRATVSHPEWIEVMALEETGAPHEHLGFGHRTNEVKIREVEFLRTHLLGGR
ncbi:MAG: hypothetical protein CMJ34_11510 [Phycisphaerae bacterium]|nr:hypothetical protein [Phycisphaerae bacterium]